MRAKLSNPQASSCRHAVEVRHQVLVHAIERPDAATHLALAQALGRTRAQTPRWWVGGGHRAQVPPTKFETPSRPARGRPQTDRELQDPKFSGADLGTTSVGTAAATSFVPNYGRGKRRKRAEEFVEEARKHVLLHRTSSNKNRKS